jgi:hypothetical protein
VHLFEGPWIKRITSGIIFHLADFPDSVSLRREWLTRAVLPVRSEAIGPFHHAGGWLLLIVIKPCASKGWKRPRRG